MNVDAARWKRALRVPEPGIGDGDVLLDGVDLDDGAASGVGLSPPERDLHAVDVAVVGVVGLPGGEAERDLDITADAEEQAGLTESCPCPEALRR
jgi:hypothetical protein